MTNFISKEVDKLIKKYKTRDPFEMAKDMKINICYHDLGNLKGYYDMSTLFWTYLNRTIYLMVYDSSVAEKNLLKVNG